MNKLFVYISALLLLSCSVKEPKAERQLDVLPEIYPDYVDVTIPSNIAPLRFMLKTGTGEAIAVLSCGRNQLIEKADENKFLFDESEWKDLLKQAKGQDI